MAETNYRQPKDEEVLEIVRVLTNGGYATEEEDDEKIELILRAYPGITNLMFHDKRRLTPEQILKEAKLKDKPICL